MWSGSEQFPMNDPSAPSSPLRTILSIRGIAITRGLLPYNHISRVSVPRIMPIQLTVRNTEIHCRPLTYPHDNEPGRLTTTAVRQYSMYALPNLVTVILPPEQNQAQKPLCIFYAIYCTPDAKDVLRHQMHFIFISSSFSCRTCFDDPWMNSPNPNTNSTSSLVPNYYNARSMFIYN